MRVLVFMRGRSGAAREGGWRVGDRHGLDLLDGKTPPEGAFSCECVTGRRTVRVLASCPLFFGVSLRQGLLSIEIPGNWIREG